MADFTASTISALQPLIKKPTLKPALLQKPPFRFLHDIVTNLQSSPSAFPPVSLFSPEQLNSELVKEKEQKLAFLQQLINIVAAVNGAPVDVSAGKIIAGMEAEKTNELLRALAKAAQAGLSEAEVVQRVDGGGVVKKKAEEAKAAPAPAAAPPAPKKVEAVAAAPPDSDAAPAVAKPAGRPASLSQSGKAAAAAPAESPPASKRSSISLPPAPSEPEDFSATTQRLLGALITRPTLKPALLLKPPFRFLHDIVTALIASPCHYPADYFTADECNSASFDSSDKKTAFLRRLLDVVEATAGCDLSAVNPKKIVAGLEPEQTNLLLQNLARAAASGITAAEAMAKRTGGVGKASMPSIAAEPVDSPPQAKPAADSPPPPAKNSKAAPLKASNPLPTSPAVPKLALQSMEADAPPPIQPSPGLPIASDDATLAPPRPMTARQGPPKPKPSPIIPSPKPADMPSTPSSHPAAPAAAPNPMPVKPGLILEGAAAADDDDIPEDEAGVEGDEGGGRAEEGERVKGFEEGKVRVEEQGGLMRKILQAGGGGGAGGAEEKEAEGGNVGVGGLKADDKAVLLRAQLQRLCHSIAPLGKCFELVVDDVDEMGREMGKWRQQREEHSAGVEDARRHTARVVEPLQAQLAEAERKLDEWERKIVAIKAAVWANERSIITLIEQKATE